ncbi:MAG: hypothetical protein E7484_00415 [Ruminococcaceae bacterium]|nr:hypothetical protein [Oscillospiraceae bacterium]
MYPIHKEKYIIGEKTFYHFMYDRHADLFRKEKRGHMIYAIAMIICMIVVTVINLINPAVKGDYVWMILPVVFAFLSIALVNKYRSADRVAYNKIMKDYEGRKYKDNYHTVKFFEDHLTYNFGSSVDTIAYNQFRKYYEGPDYFAMYFHTGDLVLFSDKCNVEKIKGIMVDFKEGLAKEKAEEAKVEETMDTVVEIQASEVME